MGHYCKPVYGTVWEQTWGSYRWQRDWHGLRTRQNFSQACLTPGDLGEGSLGKTRPGGRARTERRIPLLRRHVVKGECASS